MIDISSPDRPPADFAFAVSVRSLCAFAAKAGDLDFRFGPVPSAQEGIAGHLLVQGRRGGGYESEVTLSADFEGLRVRGRADGFRGEGEGAPRVEEIKTFRGEFDAIRQNQRALHWAQARTYGWMLCDKHDLPAIDVALVYLDLSSGERRCWSNPPHANNCASGSRRSAAASWSGRFRKAAIARRCVRRSVRSDFPMPDSVPVSATWPKACFARRPRSAA